MNNPMDAGNRLLADALKGYGTAPQMTQNPLATPNRGPAIVPPPPSFPIAGSPTAGAPGVLGGTPAPEAPAPETNLFRPLGDYAPYVPYLERRKEADPDYVPTDRDRYNAGIWDVQGQQHRDNTLQRLILNGK